jgi:hypothetical protein
MSSHNKFLSFTNSSSTESSSSTFIVNSDTKILSIEITATDELIILPAPELTKYDQIQYRKSIDTPRNIVFSYNNLQKGKIYHNRLQTIIFHKFKPLNSSALNWIT